MRVLYLFLGHCFLVLGAIGAALPLLPTVPFLILAAGCYSKGSEQLYTWMRNHPRFGRSLVDWQDHGVIRPRAKALACLLIACSLIYPLVWGRFHYGYKITAVVSMLAIVAFIVSRPSAPRQDRAGIAATGTTDASSDQPQPPSSDRSR